SGVDVVTSLAYLVGLYEQKRITLERALHALARTTRRGTLRPEWIQSGVRVVAEIRRKGEKLMKKQKHEKTTVTVRLTDEEDQVLSRLCILKKTSKTGYLARLAKEQAKRELLRYAAEEYLAGGASLSE